MPIRITRVYTRTGDAGDTALVGGRRVPKDSPRIQAYGTLDELNAALGLARVFNAEGLRARGQRMRAHRRLDEVLRRLQNELFDLGSELATPADAAYSGMFRVSQAEVTALEALIDDCQRDLGPLKSFVLPGGGRVSGFLHQARTVCRRAEREVLALSRAEPLGPWPLAYVNRLSDALFVLSRWVGRHLGETEYLWERGLSGHAAARAARGAAAGGRPSAGDATGAGRETGTSRGTGTGRGAGMGPGAGTGRKAGAAPGAGAVRGGRAGRASGARRAAGRTRKRRAGG